MSLKLILVHVISCRVWSQVNADVVELVRLSNGEMVKFSGSTKSVGRCISTKAVGSDERHDITHQYKYPEGTAETSQPHTYLNGSKRIPGASSTFRLKNIHLNKFWVWCQCAGTTLCSFYCHHRHTPYIHLTLI